MSEYTPIYPFILTRTILPFLLQPPQIGAQRGAELITCEEVTEKNLVCV